MDNLTFAVLLTAAGAGIAAGLVTSVVSLIKTALSFAANWHGTTMAFALSAVLYILAALATITPDKPLLDQGLNVFIAWLTCATAAVGIHKVAVNPALDALKSDTP